MGHIDDDAQLVHALDEFDTQSADAAVGFFGTAVSNVVAAVVGKVHKPDTHPVPVKDCFQLLFRVLKFSRKGRTVDAPDHGDLAFGVDPGDLIGGARLSDHIREGPQHLDIAGHASEILFP